MLDTTRVPECSYPARGESDKWDMIEIARRIGESAMLDGAAVKGQRK